MYGANASTSQVINDTWSYRLSVGYFDSDPFARPTGQIPLVADPRDPSGSTTVGGAFYLVDGPGPFGMAFQNSGTSQPKFDARLDQELENGRVTYAGGVAGTEGTIYTGIGPFDLQSGSVLAYGRMSYSRDALKFSAFVNVVDAEAPNLLGPRSAHGGAVAAEFQDGNVRRRAGALHRCGRPPRVQLRRQLSSQQLRYHAGARDRGIGTRSERISRTISLPARSASPSAPGSTSSAISKTPRSHRV